MNDPTITVRGLSRGLLRLTRGRSMHIVRATLIALLAAVPVGCNLDAPPPGTLAADPGLQYSTPSLVMTDAQLGPGDQLAITVYRHPDLDNTVEIPGSGIIFLPLAGDLDVRGATTATVRERITAAYAPYIKDPQISVEVAVRRSQRILVLGEVKQPGVFQLDRPSTTLDVIAEAGGFTLDGAKDAVYLHRLEDGEPVQRVLDLNAMLNKGQFENNPMVQAGDILYIPPSELAKTDRFARHVTTWMTPILMTSSIVLNANAIKDGFFTGGGTGIVVPVPTSP